ncbi:hypothetical protein HNR21_003182 [Actinomadura cellulosilytica]|uniref:Uncharacterized protein n=1 Tax=Thermomonospora cellulosilytica TaxID=1411118 RepID=A0A7W3MYL7_9ACTN|nr:hypothetical protein [Thermomonospora cellulosilytica]
MRAPEAGERTWPDLHATPSKKLREPKRTS